MREFFRGWRRKMGVATLVMASYLAFQWVLGLGREHKPASLLASVEWPEFNNGRIEYWSSVIRWKNASTALTNGEFVVTQDQLAWSIPCWSIVLPLTLVSAYLLLSKPRVAPRPTSEVTHA